MGSLTHREVVTGGPIELMIQFMAILKKVALKTDNRGTQFVVDKE
jgi:hypothetical protein